MADHTRPCDFRYSGVQFGISQLFSIIYHSLAMANMDFFLPRNRGALEAVGSRETEHVLGRR